jgi:hypothetical protein
MQHVDSRSHVQMPPVIHVSYFVVQVSATDIQQNQNQQTLQQRCVKRIYLR